MLGENQLLAANSDEVPSATCQRHSCPPRRRITSRATARRRRRRYQALLPRHHVRRPHAAQAALRAPLPPFPDLVRSLQSSLATTLAAFTPLAGKLTHRPAHDDVVIDCSAGAVSPGVMFVEAEYDHTHAAVDMLRLAGDDEHHTEAFKRLVPEMDVGRLPAPLLAVQVTRPARDGGGIVAIGVSIHHVVGDGQAVWQFMRAWSTASREGSPAATVATPVFDRKAVLRHPKDEELSRIFLRVFAPALPLVNCSMFPEPDTARQWRKTYQLRPNQIQSLKQQMLAMSELAETKELTTMEAPTTHVAVLSLYWTSLVRAKFSSSVAGGGDGDVYFMIPGDLRRRLRPPVDDGYFGNCVKGCYLRASVADLCAGDGLA
uniref:Uncharacterized protein n=1 Tax=Oryza brachyantha TaxID=4533 RepID=J3MB76_ORYBR